MTRRTPTAACLALTAFCLLSASAPGQEGGARSRIAQVLEGYAPAELEEAGASLDVAGVCVLAPPAETVPGVVRCVLQVVAEDAGPQGVLTLAVERRDQEPLIVSRRVEASRAGSPWVLLAPLELPEDVQGLAVVLEDDSTWGGTLVDVADEPLEVPAGAALTEVAGLLPTAAARPAPPPAEAATGPVLRLVPPRGEVAGSTRFDVLATHSGIERVVFFVDGERQDEDRRPPFAARLNLARPAKPQEIKAVAYGIEDVVLGEDKLIVNRRGQLFRVDVAQVTGDPAQGAVEVTADLSVPPGRRLDRLEFYWNEQLEATLREAPYKARVRTPRAGEADFVRVVAYLDDGGSIDTVQLLGALGTVEEVDVNLVELYVVVADADGTPVTDLAKEDFEVLSAGRPRPIERFTFAEDVPLLLGLVMDSSGSMQFLMEETRQAAGGFLATILGKEDRAFVVDFDSQPRLAQAATGDLGQLFASFRSMRAEGFTALYDSILFSLLQFGDDRGRKALVVLTDGDDYRSHFGPSQAIRDARTAGVPVYVIGMGEGDQLKRTFHGSEVNRVAEKTGGKVYLVDGAQELRRAYAEIDRELRGQYLLTFYAEPGVAPEKAREVEVELRPAPNRKDYQVRTVVGAQ